VAGPGGLAGARPDYTPIRATTIHAAGGRCAGRGISPRIARRGIEPSERLGRHRWPVERTLAWLVGFRYLQVRYGRHAAYLQAFLHLACALICARFLKPL